MKNYQLRGKLSGTCSPGFIILDNNEIETGCRKAEVMNAIGQCVEEQWGLTHCVPKLALRPNTAGLVAQTPLDQDQNPDNCVLLE